MAGDVSKLVPQVARRILGVLAVLDAAESLEDLQPLAGFHALQGDREGEFAVTITRNWRITFTSSALISSPEIRISMRRPNRFSTVNQHGKSAR